MNSPFLFERSPDRDPTFARAVNLLHAAIDEYTDARQRHDVEEIPFLERTLLAAADEFAALSRAHDGAPKRP